MGNFGKNGYCANIPVRVFFEESPYSTVVLFAGVKKGNERSGVNKNGI
jgi:hypothetical protein